MTTGLLPVGKIVHVCDEVISDPTSGKVSILNLWDIVRVPRGAAFPFKLGRMCVVGLFRGRSGEVTFRVELTRADTGATLRRTGGLRVRFIDQTLSKVVHVRLLNVTFPSPGAYTIELYCENVFVDDLLLTVLPT